MPLLFILSDKAMIKEVTENVEHSVKVRSEYIHEVRFVGDKAIL